MRRTLMTAVAAGAISVAAATATAAPALACGGLVAPNGTIRLTRTSTLAAFHAGLEHYVTSFQFSGDGDEVGSIVPLPGIPSKVERGGDWTLQRLVREVQPCGEATAFASPAAGSADQKAVVVYETKIDALDITILKGGGREVGQWATEHGYLLTPDAPATLEFYSRRSPIFMAARFDAQAARQRGQSSGDGTPIHLTIPTKNPWVPLRILGLGRTAQEQIDADVFLLTDRKPAFLPGLNGLDLRRDAPASDSLLNDLRADKGMEWMPSSMWLSYFSVGETASKLRYDLSVDASGRGKPSYYAAGLRPPKPPTTTTTAAPTTTTTTVAPTTTTVASTPTSVQVALPLKPAGDSRPGWTGAAAAALLGGAIAGGGAVFLPRLRRRILGR